MAFEWLLFKICELSHIEQNQEAFDLINEYSFRPLVRFFAINKVMSNRGANIVSVFSSNDKLNIYKKTNIFGYNKQ